MLDNINNRINTILLAGQKHGLNDGQVDTKVEHVDIDKLYEIKATLENELADLEGRISGTYIFN